MVTRFLERIFNPTATLADQALAQALEPLVLPTEVTIADVTLFLRLMGAGDAPAILRFARSLPPHDLLFLRRDITTAEQVDAWVNDIARGLATTVLALHDGNIVGYATVASDGLSWTRHVRELRVLVAPAMRGKHVGRLLTEQAFTIARDQGATKMVAHMTVDQHAAIEIFASMGFEPEARLHQQVMDREGHLHDLQIMSLNTHLFRAKLQIAFAPSAPEPE